MLPGGPGFAGAYMRGTAELFSDVLRSHLIDPHGSGGSTPPADPADYSADGHAHFYEEVRVALGLERVIVFGHSFGATTALTYAARFPESTDRCIAVSPLGVGTEHDDAEGGAAETEMDAALSRHAGASWYPNAKAVWDGWTDAVLAADDPGEVDRMMAVVLPLYTAYPERPEVAAALAGLARDMKSDLAASKAWEDGLYQGVDLRPVLGGVRARTLVVAGELDPICGPAQAHPICEALPNATLELIGDCGHFPNEEAPDRYRRAVTSWLRATHSAGAQA